MISGYVLSRATARDFECWWYPNNECPVYFHELFCYPHPGSGVVPPLRIEDKEANDSFQPFGKWGGKEYERFNILESTQNELRIITHENLLLPEIYEIHQDWKLYFNDALGDLLFAVRHVWPEINNVWHRILNRVSELGHMKKNCEFVGVHIRRGDRYMNGGSLINPIEKYWEAMDRHQESAGDRDVFFVVVTDDGAPCPLSGQNTRYENIKQKMKDRYGSQVFFTESHHLDRRDAESMRGAMLDLGILNKCHRIIGSAGSSFSSIFRWSKPYEAVWQSKMLLSMQEGDVA